MRVTILNGNPEASNSTFDEYLETLTKLLKANGHEVTVFTLRDMDIRYCIGCFGCWVKTPGECSSAADDSTQTRNHFINSDLVIVASPVIMGFTSALLKKVMDKMTPLVMPYVGIFEGEQHHIKRYDSYPLMGVIIQPEADTDDEDISIIKDTYIRNTLNFHSRLVFFNSISDPVEKVADEINGI